MKYVICDFIVSEIRKDADYEEIIADLVDLPDETTIAKWFVEKIFGGDVEDLERTLGKEAAEEILAKYHAQTRQDN